MTTIIKLLLRAIINLIKIINNRYPHVIIFAYLQLMLWVLTKLKKKLLNLSLKNETLTNTTNNPTFPYLIIEIFLNSVNKTSEKDKEDCLDILYELLTTK